MTDPSRSSLSIDTVVSAFEAMGEYLRERELLGEIAIYGGTAIVLQFDWRKTTEDVDAVIRTNEREGAVKDAIAYAALKLGLPDDWLKLRQQRRLDEAPAATGDAFMDAWIGAVGEHLARRGDLAVPAWTRGPEHYRLSLPRFVPDSKAVRGMLIVMSPPAFRSRLLFTIAEPLQRARFPRDVKRIGYPLKWPPPGAADAL